MKKLLKVFLIICVIMAFVIPNIYANTNYEILYDDDGNGETSNVSKNLAEGSKIKKDFNDGITPAEEVEVSAAIEIVNPTRQYYNFAGWSEVETTEYDLELKANWELKKYTVTFNDNVSGSAAQVQTQNFNFNEEKKLTKNTFEKEGYAFVKWTTNADGTGTEYADEALVSNLVDEDNGNLNLFAQWRILENYQVYYDNDGNTETQNLSETLTERSKVKKDFNDGVTPAQEIEVAENIVIENPTRQNCKFTGWSKVETTEYALELKANWEVLKYKVTFNSNTEPGSTVVQNFDFGESKKLTKNSFEKKHYDFIGWTINQNGTGTKYSDEQLVQDLVNVDNGNLNLYAQWKKADVYEEAINARNGENITKKLADVFAESKGYAQSVITIPSGTFLVGNNNDLASDNNLVIPSNTRLVLQANTELKKASNTTNSILRTRASDNSQNITITGGTFNCNNSNVNGIDISSARNVTINNVKVINAGDNRNGISISNSANVYLDKIDASNNKKSGIYVSNSSGSIKDSKSYSNTNGIMLVDKSKFTISGLTVNSNKQDGIYINNSTSEVLNSTVYQNNEQGIYINSSTVPIRNTKTYSNKQDGIEVVKASNVNIDNLQTYSNTQRGLYIIDSTAMVTNTTVRNNKVGAYINNSTINKFENNYIYDNSNIGMFITNNPMRITLQNIRVNGNKDNGIEVSSSVATLNNCNVYSNNNCGIYVNQNSKVNINSNNIYNSGKKGISIANSSTAWLKNSEIHNNSEEGIYVNYSILKANDNGNNKIYSNNYNGVSATGDKTEIYLHKNIITDNGKAGKSTSDGEIGHGVGVAEGAYANVTNNVITNNKQCGVSVFDKARTKINKNTITGNGRHGVGARQNIKIYVMKENNISNNSYNGILLADKANGNTLTNNKITNNGQFGLSVVDKATVTLSKNTITNNTKSNLSLSKGDAKRTRSKVIIKDSNTISNSKKEHGIVLSGKAILEITSKDNKIEKNNKNGISVTDNSSLKITGKTSIYGNKENGIFIKNSEANIKNANIKKNTKYGVHLENSGYLNIWSSSILNNKNYGINVSGSGAVAKITKNTIKSNKNIGIAIKNGATATEIKNNKIKKHTKYGIGIYNSTVNKNTGNTYSGNGKKVYKQ